MALYQKSKNCLSALKPQEQRLQHPNNGIPIIEMPLDNPRPTSQSDVRQQEMVTLEASLYSKLKSFCSQQDQTLFVTLLATFKTVLFRYAGQEEIVVGAFAPSDGTAREQSAEFAVPVAIHSTLTETLSAKHLLHNLDQTVSRTLLDSTTRLIIHQVDSPQFQFFLVDNSLSVNVDEHLNYSDLSISFSENEDRLELMFNYDAQLFKPTTIKRIGDHFQIVLASLIDDPGQSLCKLPLLSATERQQILVDWNNTTVTYPSDQCIQQIFEAQAAQRPNSTALIYKETTLTYGELNHRANYLAKQLKQLDVGPGGFVAIKMDRSIETIVAILGILKAGGTYVPLDPAYPKERLAFMLADTNAAVILTQSHLVDSLPPHQAKVLCLDSDWAADNPTTLANPECQNNSMDAAYVMYTSGSTGQPKGVIIPHRAILRLVLGSSYTKLDANQVLLQLAPISFDASTLEIWGALLHGARCVLYPQNGMPNPKELAEIINKHQVSTLWLTASLFNTIITEAPESLSQVKELLTGGEALSVPHIRQAIKLLPNTQLINGYGPTESTTFTCCYRIPKQLNNSLASIPIGPPIANTQTYILDAHLQPVPIGVAGELYIGGDGLATGYLNQPNLTAERFIAHPFSSNPADRLYKTGDRVRYLPDGTIEFLGRFDNQIKLRGFRIELGEIEAQLAQHESVAEAIVIMREDRPGDKRLVAYVTPQAGHQPKVTILRTYLEDKLPAYMVPSAILILAKIPLNPNGKTDRKALPAPEKKRPDLDQAYIAPQSHLEHFLVGVWGEVLQLEQIGIHDKFFELGGDSLRSHHVVSQIEQNLNISIPIVALYEAYTVSELAAWLQRDYPVEINKRFNPSKSIQTNPSATFTQNNNPPAKVEQSNSRRERLRARRQRYRPKKIGLK